MKTEATVFKNKVGPSRRHAEFPLYYDWGINDEISIMDYLVSIAEIKSGTWKSWTVNGQEYKWQGTGKFVELMKDKNIHKYVMDLLEKKLVKVFNERPDEVLEEKTQEELEQKKS